MAKGFFIEAYKHSMHGKCHAFDVLYVYSCFFLFCRKWTSMACADVNEAILQAASQMQGASGCASGGEKCLYTVCNGVHIGVEFKECDAGKDDICEAALLTLYSYTPLPSTLVSCMHETGSLRSYAGA